MLAILTEKPSAARNFDAALGGRKGTYKGENYEIVHARGHLLELMDPKAQVPKELSEEYRIWDMDNLPWRYSDIAWKKELVKGSGAADILKNISDAFQRASEVVIATDVDPSGEGEMLAFEILRHLKWNGPVSRMYFADESPKSIQQAFVERKTLDPDPKKDGDYVKAVTRQRWDFLSMQWTRAATCVAGSCGYRRVLRMGRLKSVMISLVGDQEDAIRNYVKKPFYEARFRDENGNVFAVNKDDAQRVDSPEKLDMSIYHPSDIVLTSKETKRKAPGKLLDLAGISAALASKGFKPKKVLEIYQSMYENHVVSYPRTEDKKITPEQFNELLPLIDRICGVVGVDPALLTVRTARKTHVDEKAGAHGANRPGPKVPKSLEDLAEKYGKEAPAIYELVAKNYLAMLAEDYVYEQQKGYVKDFPQFTGTANVPISKGFRQVFDDSEKDTEDKAMGKRAEPFAHEGAITRKPERPTIKWLTKKLEKYNVGTGATRTSTIAEVTKKDEKKGLMDEKKGVLSLTQNGQFAHCLLAGCNIASAEVTERLFSSMERIGRFEESPREILLGLDALLLSDIEKMQENSKGFLDRFGKGTETAGPAKKEAGIFAPTGERITYKRTWGTYTFNDEDIRRLLSGEEIEFDYTDKDGKTRKIRGAFGQGTYRGKNFWGFMKTSDDAYITGLYALTGEEIRFKKVWSGHAFSEEEATKLLAGESIVINAVSSKGSNFKCEGKLKKDKYKGKEFWGFSVESFLPDENAPERVSGIFSPTGEQVSFKRVWGGHVFTDEEVKQLLAGEPITFSYSGRRGTRYASGKLGEGEFKGKKYWGFQKEG